MTGSADGTGVAARFNSPFGVAVDSAGNIYIADSFSHTIRKVTAAGVVTTLAGTAGMATVDRVVCRPPDPEAQELLGLEP